MFRADYRARDVWTAEETADYLGCSLPHLHNLIHSGQITYFRVGRLVRFTAEPVKKFAASLPGGKYPPRAKRQVQPKPVTLLKEIRRTLGKRPASEPERCFVYFVQAESGGLIKIGVAIDPIGRLLSLQAASPLKLIILGCVYGGRRLERALHDYFRDERQHFEWFEPSARLVEFIAEALTTEGVPKEEIRKPAGIYRSEGARALLDRFNG